MSRESAIAVAGQSLGLMAEIDGLLLESSQMVCKINVDKLMESACTAHQCGDIDCDCWEAKCYDSRHTQRQNCNCSYKKDDGFTEPFFVDASELSDNDLATVMWEYETFGAEHKVSIGDYVFYAGDLVDYYTSHDSYSIWEMVDLEISGS